MSVNSEPEGAQEVPVEAGPTTAGPVEPPATAGPAAESGGVRRARVRPAGMRRTRMGGLWVVAALGAVILVLLLVFILQNGQRVEVHLFGGHWNAPLGVALLLAAALGLLLVVVPGAGRIIQLKRAARGLHRDRLDLAHQLDEATAAPADGDATNRPAANRPVTEAPVTKHGRRRSRSS
jgi:uncharacterized integral membrane protein